MCIYIYIYIYTHTFYRWHSPPVVGRGWYGHLIYIMMYNNANNAHNNENGNHDEARSTITVVIIMILVVRVRSVFIISNREISN